MSSATEYALLQQKYLRENLLKEVSSHRDRAREKEKYLLASQRNTLEQQRRNLNYGLEKLSEPVRKYYIDRISQLGEKIDANKRKYPMFRGDYDID